MKAFIAAITSTYLRPLMIVLAALIIGVAIISSKPGVNLQPVERILPTVAVTRVVSEALTLTVSAQGVVRPRTETHLIPEVDGRIKTVAPSLVAGAYIKQGEVLLTIDDEDYSDSVALAKAANIKAEVEEELASAELLRLQQLHDNNLASASQLDQARRTAKVAAATLADAKIRLKQARRDLSRTRLLAPFDGRIRHEQVDVGQFVSRGENIATAYATDYVEVRLPMADRQLAYLNLPLTSASNLEPGQQAAVTIHGEYAGRHHQWRGKLVRTEAELDANSRMIYAVVRVDNRIAGSSANAPPPLQVGMFVNAEISGRYIEQIIRLPRTSLYQDRQVLVLDHSNRLRVRSVEILRIDQDQLFISAGLQAGEQVAIAPPAFVIDGLEIVPAEKKLLARNDSETEAL